MTDELTLQRWAASLGLVGSPIPGDGRFTMAANGQSSPIEFERHGLEAWKLQIRLQVSNADIDRDWAIPDVFPQPPETQPTAPRDAFGSDAQQIASSFPLVDALLTSDRDAVTVQFVATVFDEGLNHQSFAVSLWSLLHAVEAFESVRSLRARPHAVLTRLRESAPADTMETAVAAPAPPRPTSALPATVEVIVPMPSTVRADGPQASRWSATHRVSSSTQAWQRPDPASPTTGILEARLPVQVIDRQGEWAHVVCSNGWSAWIDARNLEVQ
jgi:hypothetical protein